MKMGKNVKLLMTKTISVDDDEITTRGEALTAKGIASWGGSRLAVAISSSRWFAMRLPVRQARRFAKHILAICDKLEDQDGKTNA